jgi:hypothetical protein
LHGYRDANVFLRDHPWPADSASLVRFGTTGGGSIGWNTCLGQLDNDTDNDDTGAKVADITNKGGYQPIASTGTYTAIDMTNASNSSSSADDDDSETLRPKPTFSQKTAFQWTSQLQYQFKKEFEHLVILDYLIRNTGKLRFFVCLAGCKPCIL